MKKLKHFIQTHKLISSAVLLILIIGGVWIYSTSGNTTSSSYVVGTARKDTIVQTVTGTGQVSASSQVDIKSKASGDIVYLNTALNGTWVKKGTLIAQIDTRDAALSLESARIAYEKLVEPADTVTALQAENKYTNAQQTAVKARDEAISALADTFVELPTLMTNVNDVFYARTGYLENERSRSFGPTVFNYRTQTAQSFDKVQIKYENLVDEYKDFSQINATSSLDHMISRTYDITKELSEVIKNIQNTIELMSPQETVDDLAEARSTVTTWTTDTNSLLASLISAKNSLLTGEQGIREAKESLISLTEGPNKLDIRSQLLNLQQQQNNYDDYFIRAPFEGLLARLSVKATDTVGSGTVIGTLVSAQKNTVITLNEVDVSQVHVGQKASLTFDAIDGFTAPGTVTTVDLVGTVSQGVVNYNVEITLDVQDERIKSGMSVSASITTETLENVLTVPNSAIKTQSGIRGSYSYVEVFNPPLVPVKGAVGTQSDTAPQQKKVEVGISNDAITQILSGIEEGEQIVTRTITGSAATTATPSLFGGSRTGTGAVRIPRN